MPYNEKPFPRELEGDNWYLDSENSLLCPDCSEASNTLDEVPQFRPIVVYYPSAEDYCAQCSKAFEQ